MPIAARRAREQRDRRAAREARGARPSSRTPSQPRRQATAGFGYPGASATSSPPSSSSAGKTSATTGFSIPARVRSVMCSLSRRTRILERQRDLVAAVGEAAETERLRHVLADQVAFLKPGQLEDPAPRGEDPAVAVAGDETRGRRRVVVVLELEQKAEAAAAARRRLCARIPHARRCRRSAPCSSGRCSTAPGAVYAACISPARRCRSAARNRSASSAAAQPGPGRGDRLPVDVILDVTGGEDAGDVRLRARCPRDQVPRLGLVIELVEEERRCSGRDRSRRRSRRSRAR